MIRRSQGHSDLMTDSYGSNGYGQVNFGTSPMLTQKTSGNSLWRELVNVHPGMHECFALDDLSFKVKNHLT